MTIQSSSLSSTLAPGFRFHPTDDELVSYYLKRKKSNLPLLVDAISYIDLYKYEPWDLPSLSKLKTRDMEYYFFTTLDRKHDSRIRTSRRTLDGYWKTTGKDREVYGVGKVVVGMKKTLVYHSGRAPTGARSNWVMHEYRLNGDSSSTANDSQETLVLCRIFQKNGSGPQNGAQYGAPFREEEWVEGQGFGLEANEGEFDGFMHADDLKENQALAHGHGSVALVAKSEGNVESVNVPDTQVANTNINIIEATHTLEKQVENNTGQNDGYLELKDIFETADGSHNDDFFGHTGANYGNEPAPVSQFDYTTLYLDNANENMNSSGPGPVNSLAQPVDAKLGAVGENVFYDAFSHNYSFTEDNLDEMNNASGYDMVDDLFAYFDATENNLQNDMEIFNSTTTSQVNVNSEVEHVQEKHIEKSTSYSASSNQNETSKEGNNAPSGWKSSLKKQVVNMLGSISAPPAMAEECSKLIKGNSATKLLRTSTPSVHASAGVIKIQNIILTETMDLWSTEKIIEHSEHDAFSTALRCWLYLFGISVLVLSAGMNIGICFYSR